MAKHVRTKADAGNGTIFPESLEVPFKVSDGHLRIILCAEEEGWRVTGRQREALVLPKNFPQLNGVAPADAFLLYRSL